MLPPRDVLNISVAAVLQAHVQPLDFTKNKLYIFEDPRKHSGALWTRFANGLRLPREDVIFKEGDISHPTAQHTTGVDSTKLF
jgi:hypothetical protein